MKSVIFTIFSSAYLLLTSISQSSDLKPDPKTIFGSLDNGFRYIIRPNAEPPGRFSVRLHIAAGSLMESDDQRGLAHFLEHMVFNGTRNFTSAELIPKMQRLGISFGAHANAYTSFDETVYMLDLPNLKKETVDLTYTVMRDFADGALLKDEEIEKERGVIISEKTSRDSVGYRMMLKQFEYLLPGSRLIQRVPIGTEEVIKNAKRERFTDFYTRFYTPERMTFIATGDFDAKEMEKRIRETFISLTNPKKPGETPAQDIPPKGFGFRAEIFTDKEITSDELSLNSIRPFTRQPDTKAERLSHYPLSAAHAILSRRFEILAKKEHSPILNGGADRNIYFNQLEAGGISVSPAEDQWEKAIPLMEQEFRRAREHGFTQAELDEISAAWLNQAEQAVKRADTRESAGLAMAYVNSINDKRTVITPQANLLLTQEGIASLTLDKIHDAFKAFWKTEDLSLILTTNEATDEMKSKLSALYLESQKIPVSPPVEQEQQSFAYTDFGAAGAVDKTTIIEDLEITQLSLSNGIRVNLKKTDFKKNTISIFARFGSGTFTMPQDKPGLHTLASAVFNSGGLGKHSDNELQRLLAGKNVDTAFHVTNGSFSLSGRTTPEDLELQLQLMCAYFTDPGFRPEGERQFKMQTPLIYNQLKHTMGGPMVQMQNHLSGNDFRSLFPKEEDLQAYTTEMVQQWLKPALKDSPLEISVVGDFQQEAVISCLLKTFGTLPTRKTTKPDFKELRKITLPQRPSHQKYTFDSKIPNGAAVAAWIIPTGYENQKLGRRFNLLASILSDRLREEIREKLGGSYSPRASARPDPELELGYIQAMAQVKPEETQKYGELMVELADQLAQKGVTQDELERAIKPLQSNLKESLRNNGYWLNTVMAASQEQPYWIDLARTRDQDYASITAEELSKLAAEYLKKSNSLIYEIIPKAQN